MRQFIDGLIILLGSSLAASIVLKATVITTLGLMGAWLARRSRAAVRHAVLAASFAALLALPIASVLITPVRITVPAAAHDWGAPSFFSGSIDSSQFAASGSPSAGFGSPTTRWPTFSPLALLFVGWLAGTVFFLLRMIIGLRQVHLMRDLGLPWRQGQSVVERLVLDVGIRRHVEVLLHESLPAPVTCGFVNPAIVLPPDAQNWDREDLNRAIMHELEHVRRGDWVSHCLARVVCAAYWFHPLVWIAWRQLALEAERACDDVVLTGSEATAYADQLVGLARRLSMVRKPAALAMANRSDLSARVAAVLDGRRRRGRAGAMLVALTCIASAVVVVTMSPLRMVRAPQMASTRAQKPLTFDTASVKMTSAPDGVAVNGNTMTVGKGSGVAIPRNAGRPGTTDPGRIHYPLINGGGNASPGMPGIPSGGSGSLLRAQIVPAQATRLQEPASSSTQPNPFEAIPEPPQASLPKVSGPTIEAIEFQGTHVPRFALLATITSRVGAAYDIEALLRDSQSLYNTGRFSDVLCEAEPGLKGVIVRFVIVQRPLIQSIEYQGDDTVTVPEILERFKQLKVNLRPATLYHEDELGRAAAAVQELVAEWGRRNITVTPLVEANQPSTVKITFRVEKQE